jgi:hypothetical protein
MDPDLDLKRRQSIDKTVAIPINTENPNHINLIKNALKLHLKLAQVVTPKLWKIVDTIATMKADCTYVQAQNRHSSKLE